MVRPVPQPRRAGAVRKVVVRRPPRQRLVLRNTAGTARVRRGQRALEGLRPEQRRLLQLSIYQGLSHDKIAEATGLPLGTVKTHIRRGLIQLRDMLSGNTGAQPMGVMP